MNLNKFEAEGTRDPKEALAEWKENYGNMSYSEIRGTVIMPNLSTKISNYRASKEQEQVEAELELEAKYKLPFNELVKAVAQTEKQVEALKGKPEELLSAKKKELENEYKSLVNAGMFDERDTVQKELFISKKLVMYMGDSAGEYRKVKTELQSVERDLSIFRENVEQWKVDHADIIKAEQIRTMRDELMRTDPEVLKVMGIAVDPAYASVSTATVEADPKDSLRNALRAIHPSATDAEIEGMVKLV